MKRLILILLFLSATVYAVARNDDPHLKRLIECINDSDFSCAYGELAQVRDWTYDEDYQIDDVDKYLAFVKYIQERDSATNLNNINLYYADQLKNISDFYHDNNDLHRALYFLQLIQELELEKSKAIRFTDAFILILQLEILENESKSQK